MHLCVSCRMEREQRAARDREERASKLAAPLRCLRCGDFYTRQRISGHFCDGCADARKREINRENERRRYAGIKELIEQVSVTRPEIPREILQAVTKRRMDVTDILSERNAQADWTTADSLLGRLEEIGLADDRGGAALGTDKLPEGAKTPLGPNEGRSTFFEDLQNWLKKLSEYAASDPWWDENPHVFYKLGADAEHKYDLAPGLRCGDKRGEYAGHKRHERAKEADCPECALAYREYKREQMKERRAS